MPLQRAIVGFGQTDCLARGGLAAREIVEPFENLREKHVRRHELPNASLQFPLDLELPFRVGFRFRKVLLAKRKIGEYVFDGRGRFTHELLVLGKNVVRPLQRGACRRKVALPESHEREADERLLQLDAPRARNFLADLEGPLPRRRGIGIAPLPLIDPRVGDVDVRHFRGLDAIRPLENRLREVEQRNGFRELISERDHRHGERARPPRELGGLLAMFRGDARNGHAHDGHRGVRIRLGFLLHLFAKLGERCREIRRRRCTRAHRRQLQTVRRAGIEQQAGADRARSPVASPRTCHGVSGRMISIFNTPSAGTSRWCFLSTARTDSGTGRGRSASIPCTPKRS